MARTPTLAQVWMLMTLRVSRDFSPSIHQPQSFWNLKARLDETRSFLKAALD